MPRLARLDAPEVLHHVIGLGIERRKIFYKDKDREDFVWRLAGLAEKGAWAVYAWVLMPKDESRHFVTATLGWQNVHRLRRFPNINP